MISRVPLLLALCVNWAAGACCWCDSDTPEESRTTTGSDSKKYDLVFSDEFNALNRSFANGQDSKWTALDAPHFSMVYFKPEQITTVSEADKNVVRIRSTKQKIGNKTYVSGMLQGWNKFCFTGGIIEFSVKFPASPGYWPAVWMFGNLGRAVFEDSCTDVWPWTFDVCDKGLQDSLPPNQRQKIQTCNATPGVGLNPRQGRGAPEIDIVEGWGGDVPPAGNVMQNFQIAPRIPRYLWPSNGSPPAGTSGAGSWYRGLKFGDGVTPGMWYGHQAEGCNPGTCPDVLGCSTWSTTMSSAYHTVRMEWKTGPDGYMKWYWGGQLTMHIPAKSLTRVYEGGGETTSSRQIPNEPMYLMANIALSDHFAGGQKAVKIDPGDLMVDWIRVYQDPERINTGCSPEDYPTEDYIIANQGLYGPPVTPVKACPAERHGLPPVVTGIVIEAQGLCDSDTNFYTQDVTISFANLTSDGAVLRVNFQKFELDGTEVSPMVVTLSQLEATGLPVDITAQFEGAATNFFLPSAFVAPPSCLATPAPSNEATPPSSPDTSAPSEASAPSERPPTLQPQDSPTMAPPVSNPTAGQPVSGSSPSSSSWSGAMSMGVIALSLAFLVVIAGVTHLILKRRPRIHKTNVQDSEPKPVLSAPLIER